MRFQHAWKIIFLVFLIILSVLFFFQIFDRFAKGYPEVIFLQTIDGDAVYIRTAIGKEIIIDGGIDSSVLHSLSRHRLFWDKQIDLLVITHPDADHYYGALEIMKRFQVHNLLVTGVLKSDPKYAELFAIASAQNTNFLIGSASQDFTIDAMIFDILSPVELIYGSKELNTNNEAFIIKVMYKHHSLLLTSDIEAETEQKILSQGVDVSAEVLKVAHHGSKSSSTPSFLQAVRPSLAVITAGTQNRFGHPHQEILNRFSEFSIPVRSTKLEGDIVLEWK